MGVEGQSQMLMPSLISVMVMPGMQMGERVASKRKEKGNNEAMDGGLVHGVLFYGGLAGMSIKDAIEERSSRL